MRTAAAVLLVLLIAASCSIISEAKLEQSVISALSADSRTSDYSFEVSVQGEGQVLITGEVDTAVQVAAVREVALTVDGVDAVINNVHMPEPGSGLLQDEAVTTPYF